MCVLVVSYCFSHMFLVSSQTVLVDTVTPHVEHNIQHGSGAGVIQASWEEAQRPKENLQIQQWCQKSVRRWRKKQLKCCSSSPTAQQLRISHGRSCQAKSSESRVLRRTHELPRDHPPPVRQSCSSHTGGPVESCTVTRSDIRGRHETGRANAV